MKVEEVITIRNILKDVEKDYCKCDLMRSAYSCAIHTTIREAVNIIDTYLPDMMEEADAAH